MGDLNRKMRPVGTRIVVDNSFGSHPAVAGPNLPVNAF